MALIRGGSDARQPVVVDTLGGFMHVRWAAGAAAKPNGQLVFFAEFLGPSACSSAECWRTCYSRSNLDPQIQL